MPRVGEPIPAPVHNPAKPLPPGAQTMIQVVPQNAPIIDTTPTTNARPNDVKEPF
jgi:hypothetical protein